MIRDDVEQLRDLVQHCLQYDGPYQLSSGQTSKYYYEGKDGTLHPPTAWLIGNLLVDVVLDCGAEAIGGLELGSIPISDATGIAAHLRGEFLPTFIVRKEPKRHGTESQVASAHLEQRERLLRKGRRVVVVDDVITTGGSIAKAIDVVQQLGCEVVAVIALVERHESNGTALRGRGFPVWSIFRTDEDGHLHISDEFVRRAEEAAERRLVRS